MTVLSLGHIIATYNIKYEKANAVQQESEYRLYDRAYKRMVEENKAQDMVVDDELRYFTSLKITERYARRYHGAKQYDY